MSHFAEIDKNGIVLRVIVSEQDFINSGAVGDSFNWVQTSYNNEFRNKFAVVGDTYDKTKDAFVSPQPYDSWTLDSDGKLSNTSTSTIKENMAQYLSDYRMVND